MTVRVRPAFDAIAANIDHLPRGQHLGYSTGTDGTNGTLNIRWTEQEFAVDPGAMRICQDAGATDHTADMLDIERGAATLDDVGPWCRRALTSFHAVERPGQREPSLYASASNIPGVVTRLREDGVHGVFLVVANWNLDDAEATAAVEDASGEYPVVGIQWASRQFYDVDVLSVSYLNNVSRVVPVSTDGPFLHMTNGKESGDEIAARRGEGFLSLLSYTAEHYSEADVSQLGNKVLTAGIPYYTRRP